MGKYLPILTIARCGSFNKAAGELGYSQPNLWHIVNNLEDDLGAKLFHRSRQGATLTDVGKLLLERMARIEAQEDSLYQAAQTFRKNQVRVGLCPGLSGLWVAELLAALKTEVPDLHVKLEMPERYREGREAVADQGLDLCFSVLPGTPEVEAVTLWDESYCLVVGEAHPLAGCERVSLQDVLGQYPLIPNSESLDPDSPLWGLYRRAEHVLMADSAPMDARVSIALAEKGLGVAILPGRSLDGGGERVRCVPLTDGPRRTVSLLCGTKAQGSPSTKQAVGLIRSFAAEA